MRPAYTTYLVTSCNRSFVQVSHNVNKMKRRDSCVLWLTFLTDSDSPTLPRIGTIYNALFSGQHRRLCRNTAWTYIQARVSKLKKISGQEQTLETYSSAVRSKIRSAVSFDVVHAQALRPTSRRPEILSTSSMEGSCLWTWALQYIVAYTLRLAPMRAMQIVDLDAIIHMSYFGRPILFTMGVCYSKG